MFNALKNKQLSKLVQVGIRDVCEEEIELIKSDSRITTFFDKDLKEQQFEGKTWKQQCEEIVSKTTE